MRALLLLLALPACGTATAPNPDDNADDAVSVLGRCTYTNPFSQGPECKEYRGADWTAETATADCDAPLLAAPAGTFEVGVACAYDSVLGTCFIDEGEGTEVVLVFPGDDPADCGGVAVGCSFGGGAFVPSALCEETDAPPTGGPAVFQAFEQVCVEDPRDGETGETCAWGAISACAEPGLRFDEVASCEVVLTQRPYAPKPPTTAVPSANDPRRDDATYLAELAWVTEQVEACACICCHSTEAAPSGPSDWYLEFDDLWIDSLDDDGLAMLAGWIDSTAFGAFPPADNNGFSRDETGLPTTDVARMKAFLEGELTRRGFEEADFADTPPFGGPLYEQLVYEPGDCASGQGIDADGRVVWSGGPARYVYVLEPGSMSPGVPPNLDTPEGTLWRLDVDPDDDPIASGIPYGTVPSGATQAFPAAGAPAALTQGQRVYVVALRDVYQPLMRCVAVVP